MKPLAKIFSACFFSAMLTLTSQAVSAPSPAPAGFYMPDSVQEFTMRFKNLKNLIILPVIINDTIEVNLILDTGCRNLVLFGKKFQKLFSAEPGKKVQFSGLGAGRPVIGSLSLGNKVTIGKVIGEKIPVVVVPERNLFGAYANVHGVIGYDIFVKFEVEFNFPEQRITFRPAATADISSNYTRVPIRVEDSRPLIDCRVVLTKNKTQVCDLMIDTGSTLGLLLKTTEIDTYSMSGSKTIIGRGFNGVIEGIETITQRLHLSDLEIKSVKTGIVESSWHNYASIGMEVMKDYSMVLNYCKGYAGFRKA